MATTSGNLAAGTAITARGGNGKGDKGRAAGLIATAALGLALLGGLIFGQVHQAGQTAGAQNLYPYVIDGAQYPAGGVQVGNSTSDYGTAFDPYIIQGSQPRSVPSSISDPFTDREDHR